MSRRATLLICALPSTLLLGCKPKNVYDTSPDTESPYVYKDTGAVEESDPPGETADSLPPDETAPPVDTEDTGDPIEPTIASLRLYPDQLAVFPGAELSLRLVAEDQLGTLSDVDFAEAALWSDDEAVATVDAASGLALAVAEGSTSLWASFGGLDASVGLEVIPAGTAEITVVDLETGLPVENPFGSVPEGSRLQGDSAGLVRIELVEPGPVTFNAWSREHVPASIVGTVSRRLTVPVRRLDSVQASGVEVGGSVDFSSVPEGSYTDVVCGLSAATIPVHPLSFDLDNLVAEDRVVSIWGVDVELPGNLFIATYVETWQGLASAGDFGVWSLAGAVPIEEITAGLNGDSAAIDLVVANLDAFVHGWSAGWTGLEGDSVEIPVAPDTPLDEPVVVEVPPLSLGFSGDEDPLVLVFDQAGDGSFAVAGLGQGNGTVAAQRVPDGGIGHGASWALAMAQVDGLGSGYGMALSAAPVESGMVELPAFQIVPSLDRFDGHSREYSFETDPRAELVRIVFEGGHGEPWDLYFPSGLQAGVLSRPQGYDIAWGQTQWTLSAIELSADTFEGLVTQGALSDEALAPWALTVGRMGMGF